MRTMIILARVLAILGLTILVMSACGSSESAAPKATVDGPALIFFYTDP